MMARSAGGSGAKSPLPRGVPERVLNNGTDHGPHQLRRSRRRKWAIHLGGGAMAGAGVENDMIIKWVKITATGVAVEVSVVTGTRSEAVPEGKAFPTKAR